MDRMPSSVEAAELRHNDSDALDLTIPLEAQALAYQEAEEAICEPDRLREVFAWSDPDLLPYLARICRSLDSACKGDPAAINAVLTSCSHMQRDLRRAAYEMVYDDCLRSVEDQYANGRIEE